MKPSAKALYASAVEFVEQPDSLQIWPGHGAGSACGKSLGNMPHSTIGYEKGVNPGLQAAAKNEQAFLDYILEAQPEPPLYFARMKQLNKAGVPLLRRLPIPDRMSVQELARARTDGAATFIDTRLDRADVMRAHLPGALYAPLNAMFCTVVGSFIPDVEAPIILIVDEAGIEEATRRLVRIGYDKLIGYAEPRTQQAHWESSDDRESLELTDFAELERRRSNAAVIDVRSLAEYQEGHVPDAVHAPYTRLPEYLDRVPTKGQLLVHCGSGARASVAAAYLARTGRDVTVVNDLFPNYRKVGSPVSD